MPRRTPLVAIACLLAVTACGASDGDDANGPESTPVPTVQGVGMLPDTIPVTTADESAEPVVSVVVTRPVDEETGTLIASVAERVNGNRLLVIGDSIMASTASRFGGEMCDELVPLGWAVEVDAEPGRFVEFGQEVVEQRVPDEIDPADDEDWDAAAVHLGSNYRGDRQDYYDRLNEILWILAPRPTLLYTVTEYRSSWSEVNEVVRELADIYENVILIDWEKAARTPGVLGRDGLHPNDAGEELLVGLTAAALGAVGGEGDCLPTSFRDDSAIGRGGGSSTGGSSSSSSTSRGSSSSGSSSSSSSSSSTGGSSSGSTSGGSTTTTSSSSGGSTGTTTSSGSTTGSTTTGGTTDGSTTDTTGGSTDGSTTDTTGGTTDGSTTDGSTTGGTDTGGTTDGSTTDTTGGTTDGSTTGTETTGGTTDGSTGGSESTTTSGSSSTSTSTGGGESTTTSGSTTTGGSTTSASTTTSGSTTTGGTTTSGSTTTGSTTTGSATTGSTSTGGTTTAGSTTGGETSTTG